MPYISDQQRKFFHTKTARKKGITAAMVKEYDQASKGKKLPKRKKKKHIRGSVAYQEHKKDFGD